MSVEVQAITPSERLETEEKLRAELLAAGTQLDAAQAKQKELSRLWLTVASRQTGR